jgi:hypothetical protein
VEVRFAAGAGLVLGATAAGGFWSEGGLDARGAADSVIVFTSAAAVKAPGDWKGLAFGDLTADLLTRLAHCVVEYGGGETAGLVIASSSPNVTDCIVRHNAVSGVFCGAGATPTVKWSKITGNAIGLTVENASPDVRFNVLQGNSQYDVENRGATPLTARHNEWGSVSTAQMAAGPYPRNVSAILDALDSPAYGSVDYRDWVTFPAVLEVTPDSVANGISVPLTVRGMGLSPATYISLERTGQQFVPTVTSVFVDSTRIAATFDLSSRQIGAWSVVAKDPGGASGTLRDGLYVGEAQAQLWAQVTGRTTIRAGRPQTMVVRFGNAGTSAVDAANLLLWIPHGFGYILSYRGLPLATETMGAPSTETDVIETLFTGIEPDVDDYALLTLTAPFGSPPATISVALVEDLVPFTGDRVGLSPAGDPLADPGSSAMISQTSAAAPDCSPSTNPSFRRSDGGPLQPGDLIRVDARDPADPPESRPIQHVLVYLGGDQVGHIYFGHQNNEKGGAETFSLHDLTSQPHAGRSFTFVHAWPPPSVIDLSALSPSERCTRVAERWNALAENTKGYQAQIECYCPPPPDECKPECSARGTRACIDVVLGIWNVDANEGAKRALGRVTCVYDPMSNKWHLTPPSYSTNTLFGYLQAAAGPQSELRAWLTTQWVTFQLPQISTCRERAVDLSVLPVAAYDPNEKSGPSGLTSLRHVTEATPLDYVVDFENLSSATAAAQEIVVLDTLDTALDATTLRVGRIQIGNEEFDLGERSLPVDTVFSLNDTTTVHLELIFTPASRTFTSHLSGQDTRTFDWGDILPPNVAPPEGQGQISFRLMQQPGLPSGTLISNRAAIVFDANPEVLTNRATNIVDREPPASSVSGTVDRQGADGLDVHWSGADGPAGSGVAHFELLVSKDGGPWVPWAGGAAESTVTFPALPNHLYDFVSVATDSVGHQELLPTRSDLSLLNASFAALAGQWRPTGLSMQLPADSLPTLFPGGAFLRWDPANREYQLTDSVAVTDGFWLAFPSDTTVALAAPPVRSYTRHLPMGWHLLSGVAPTATTASIQDDPDGAIAGIFRWDADSLAYLPATTIGPNQAVWIGVLEACDVEVGPSDSIWAALPVTDRAQKLSAFEQMFGAMPPPLPTALAVLPARSPASYALGPLFPNPFGSELRIRFALPRSEQVEIEVFDVAGRRVRRILSRILEAGIHEVRWDGSGERSSRPGSGIYFCRMKAGPFSAIRRVVLVR